MASERFPGPNYNRIIESDPQVVKVDMETAEWGARKSAQPKDIRNGMTIKHVSNKG